MNKLSRLYPMALLKDELLFPEYTREEIFLLANRLVATGFGFLFFATAPLDIREGENIGTIIILDKNQREFSESDQYLLESLASFIVEETRRRQGDIEEFQL